MNRHYSIASLHLCSSPPPPPPPFPGSGLGRLMSLRFAALGCRLVLWDVNESWNQETEKLVQAASSGAKVKAYTVDLSDREQVYAVADKVWRGKLAETFVTIQEFIVGSLGICSSAERSPKPESTSVLPL